jgi:hypothetical protein
LPIVKSKKPGTLRLSNEMIDAAETRDMSLSLLDSNVWVSLAIDPTSIIVTPWIGSARRPMTRPLAFAG